MKPGDRVRILGDGPYLGEVWYLHHLASGFGGDTDSLWYVAPTASYDDCSGVYLWEREFELVSVPDGMPEHQFIVKVQAPLITSCPKPFYLVYNEDRSVEHTIPIGDLPELDAAMKNHDKRFFGASLISDPQRPDGPGKLLAVNPFWPVADPGW